MAKKKTTATTNEVKEVIDAGCIVDLVQSIIKNDINSTKENVSKVNVYTDAHQDVGYLDLTFKPTLEILNECYFYAVDNVKHLENRTSIIYNALMIQAETLKDNRDAEDAIRFALDKENGKHLSLRQCTSLMNLCLATGLYKYLDDIKELIKTKN